MLSCAHLLPCLPPFDAEIAHHMVLTDAFVEEPLTAEERAAKQVDVSAWGFVRRTDGQMVKIRFPGFTPTSFRAKFIPEYMQISDNQPYWRIVTNDPDGYPIVLEQRTDTARPGLSFLVLGEPRDVLCYLLDEPPEIK